MEERVKRKREVGRRGEGREGGRGIGRGRKGRMEGGRDRENQTMGNRNKSGKKKQPWKNRH